MNDPILGVRRPADLTATSPPESDPGLVARIGSEIAEHGPMTFARFMELALYDPVGGYYTVGERGPGGAGGDFLTAPESHPIFGWALGVQVEEVWERLGSPRRFVIREHGAGRGALAASLLDGLRRRGSPLLQAVRYQPSDVAGPRLDILRGRLDDAGLGAHLDPPDDAPAPGVVIANELLDALPVHRVVGGEDGGLLESFVASVEGGSFVERLATPSTPALAERLSSEDIHLAPGQQAEIRLGVDEWVRRAVAPLERGLLLVIDYGRVARELYAPDRGSTLRAYTRHRVHDDPFRSLGRQDLTAHVDLTDLERAALAAGLEHVGRTTQGEFLTSLGIGDALVGLQAGPDADLPSYLAARSALIRMIDPAAMGRFAVELFARSLPTEAPLRGLTFRLPATRVR